MISSTLIGEQHSEYIGLELGRYGSVYGCDCAAKIQQRVAANSSLLIGKLTPFFARTAMTIIMMTTGAPSR